MAQQGTSSPYSYYGIGDVKFSGTVESRSMGGISVFPDSIHMNLQNPAQFASLKLTNYALGGTVNKTTFLTEDKTENANRSSIDYLAAAFPLKKFGFAIGAKPFTSVGYRIIDGYQYLEYERNCRAAAWHELEYILSAIGFHYFLGLFFC